MYHVRNLRLCSCQNRNLTEHHEKSIVRPSPVPDDNVHHKDAVCPHASYVRIRLFPPVCDMSILPMACVYESKYPVLRLEV